VSKEALRSRVQRRRIQAYKGEDGQWRVILPDDDSRATRGADASGSATGVDAPSRPGLDPVAMIDLLREQLAAKDGQITNLHQQLADRSREVAELHLMIRTAQQHVERLISAGYPPAGGSETATDAPESSLRDEAPDTGRTSSREDDAS
jgi:hypothetical protein